MIRFRELPERLFVWQQSVKNRWILTVVFLLCAAGLFGPLCWSSYQYSLLRERIAQTLREANIAERNPIAVQLIERGTVTIDGIEIGGLRVQAVADQMFAVDGRVFDVVTASSFIASVVSPGWAPVALMERPTMVLVIALSLTALSVMAIWVALAIPFIVLVFASFGLMTIFWLTSQLGWVIAVAGIGFLIFLFLLLTRIALISLSSAGQIRSVAHTLLLEAVRQRISVGCIGALLVVLPLLPLWIDAGEPLRYQIQSFISRGTGLVFIVAAFLTLFLACATVAFEIRDRQIWNVLTKPISRAQYLAGKVLGLAVLNGLVLLVGSFAVFVYVQLMSTRPAADLQDAAAVQNQVLVARAAERPQYTVLEPDRLREIVNTTIENDAILRDEIADGIKSEAEVSREIRVAKVTQFMTEQRTVAPGQGRVFEFSGLKEARAAGAQPTLRYAFHIGSDSSHDLYPVLLSFGDLPPIQVNYVPVQRNVATIPVTAIGEDGTLRVTIFNGGVGRDGQLYPAPWSMNFDMDGLEVLHRVGGFEANFLRAILIDWGKLIFIAALGVAAASVLSFPVAVLLALTVFIVGSMSPFLALALDNFTIAANGNFFLQLFEAIIRGVLFSVQWLLAPFAATGGSAELVDGRLISWQTVLGSVAQIGLLWSLLVFIFGFLLFRAKEIAIYSGGEG